MPTTKLARSYRLEEPIFGWHKRQRPSREKWTG